MSLWKKPELEILDVSLTMNGFWGGGGKPGGGDKCKKCHGNHPPKKCPIDNGDS